MEKIPYKIYLEEKEMPRAWYNIKADEGAARPVLPGTLKPCVNRICFRFLRGSCEPELNDKDGYIEIRTKFLISTGCTASPVGGRTALRST